MQPIANSIAAMRDELTAWRRDLHRHPELGYEEERTAGVVAEKLRAFGLDAVETGIGVTGVVGVLHGRGGARGEDRSILLRSDMDALAMTEETGAEHASRHPGAMHACGHDGHITMLLGAAKHLAETRNFDGTVYFCFQPAEERGAGAKAMLRDGLLERFPARAVYGMHNWPGLPVGEFAVEPGPVMAAADEFRVEIRGRGGHAAEPHMARDPVFAGAQFVSAVQGVVSRVRDPMTPAVISITTFNAGTASNVIPETASLSGTVRAFDMEVYRMIHEEMARIGAQLGAALGVDISVSIVGESYPPTVNDPEETAFADRVLSDLVGADRVRRSGGVTMGGEDFSFMAQERPGAFVFIGNGSSAPLHHPRYDFDDEAAPLGVAYWARLVEAALPVKGE